MKGFKCGSNVEMYRGAGNSAGKCILNMLKAFNLCERKSVVKRITIARREWTMEVAIVAAVVKSRV